MDFFSGSANVANVANPANPAVNPASTQLPKPRSMLMNSNKIPNNSNKIPNINSNINSNILNKQPQYPKIEILPDLEEKSEEISELEPEPPKYNGFSSSGNEISGITGSFPRGKVSINSRVPVLNVVKVRNRSPNIKSVAYVSPQGYSNNIEWVRKDVRQQNFIREVTDYVGRVMGLRNKKMKDSINIDDISSVLRGDISEDDAIYIYNILILLILLIFTYVNYYIKKEYDNGIIQKKILNEYKNRSLKNKINNTIADIALASITAVIFSWTSFVGGPIIIIPFMLRQKYNNITTYIKYEGNLKEIIMIIFNLLLSDKNTIPAKNIKDKLKYWGLKQVHVDDIFDENGIFGIVSKLDVTNKEDFNKIMNIAKDNFRSVFHSFLSKNDGPLAPNRPLSKYVPSIILSCKDPKNNIMKPCPFKIVGGYRNTKKVKKTKKNKRSSRKL